MRYRFSIAIAILVIVSFGSAFASPSAPSPANNFQTSSAWKKLDAGTQAAWLAAQQANNPAQRIDCFVRVQAPADQGDESFLFSTGYQVRTFAGPVATGHVQAKDLPNVAALPFVMSIKLAKP